MAFAVHSRTRRVGDRAGERYEDSDKAKKKQVKHTAVAEEFDNSRRRLAQGHKQPESSLGRYNERPTLLSCGLLGPKGCLATLCSRSRRRTRGIEL